MVQVGDICAARKKLGLSQEKFAEMLGVSRNTVSRWERGEFNPTADKLAALEQLLARLEASAAPEEASVPEERSVPGEATVPEERPVPEETSAQEETTVPEEGPALKEGELPSAAVPAKARRWPMVLMCAGILCALLMGVIALIGVCSIRREFGQTDSTSIRIYDEAELEPEKVDGVPFMEPITLQPVQP